MSLTIRPIDQIERALVEAGHALKALCDLPGVNDCNVHAWKKFDTPNLKFDTTDPLVFKELLGSGYKVREGEIGQLRRHPTISPPTWYCHAEKKIEGTKLEVKITLKVEMPGWQDGDEEPSL